MQKLIVKHKNTKDQDFSSDKLKNNLLLNAQAINIPEGQAFQIADIVCKDVETWLKNRTEVTSSDIRRVTTKSLGKLHKGLAYFYSNQETII